jgi:small subunit ribosomal protein S16
MVKIRLRRVGRKHRPIYQIVAADSRSPRDGKFIEIIGHYNPLTDPATIDINEEKTLKWLTCGAQLTDTVSSFLRKLGIMDKFKTR